MFEVQDCSNGKTRTVLTTDNFFEAIALEAAENDACERVGYYPTFRTIATDSQGNKVRVIVEYNV